MWNKDTIVWAMAHEGRSEPEYRGEIANRTRNIDRLIQRLNNQFRGEVLSWRYEAGPDFLDVTGGAISQILVSESQT